MGVPTVMLFREGKLVERMTGFRPRKALEKLFLSKL
jgi:thioredoxin-like negative regulator of GroEL